MNKYCVSERSRVIYCDIEPSSVIPEWAYENFHPEFDYGSSSDIYNCSDYKSEDLQLRRNHRKQFYSVVLERLKKDGHNPKRGDIINLKPFMIEETNNGVVIYDGNKLVDLDQDGNLPEEFSFITEFPIKYFSEDIYDENIIHVNCSKFNDQIFKNLVVDSNSSFFDYTINLRYGRGYAWSKFKVPLEEQIVEELREIKCLYSDINNLIEEYLTEVYFILFTFRCQCFYRQHYNKKGTLVSEEHDCPIRHRLNKLDRIKNDFDGDILIEFAYEHDTCSISSYGKIAEKYKDRVLYFSVS